MKHPVVGDDVYGGGRDNTVKDPSLRAEIRKMERHFLHAQQLSFRHPKTKAKMNFKAPLPTELQQLLDHLESLRKA
jgi:23S rRNA pseudouridine1911/1915/1917 synthase